MDVPFFVSLVWLVCMAAAVRHAAGEPAGRADLLWVAAGFGAMLAVSWGLAIPTSGDALLIGLTCAWQLVRPVGRRGSFALSGASAGLAASLYAAHGAPIWAAALASLVILALGRLLLRDQRFLQAGARQGVLLGLAWIAPLLAAAPDIIAGWQSAQALNRSLQSGAGQAIPIWALGFAAVAVLLGLLRGYWVRR